METPSFTTLIIATLVVIFTCFSPVYPKGSLDFIQCLYTSNQTSISNVVYTPINSSYTPILEATIRNLRFQTARRPLVIITPVVESQIQTVVYCARTTGLQIRTRSGGHDYEGLSYRSPVPFVILDMFNFRNVTVNVEEQTALVQAGATLGELYYAISQASSTLAYPAGVCPNVAAGGHISGGGYGPLLRKFALAADHVLDIRMIDVRGRILNKKSMGEDLFWALRGGGAGSFGIVTHFKIELVTVPEILTIFSVNRTLEQNLTSIFYKWQYVVPNLTDDAFNAVYFRKANPTVTALQNNFIGTFNSVFLGGADEYFALMQESLPELGLTRDDFTEVSWIQSALFWGNYPIDSPPQVLTDRIPFFEYAMKAKSDYVREPIPLYALERFWKIFAVEEANRAELILSSFGGKNSEIPESAIPFPHRAGNIYKFLHTVYWNETGGAEASERHLNWMRKMYNYLTPYVSKNPRRNYANYRDLDIGVNNDFSNTSYQQASVWGTHYFINNFNRLARVKTMIDPGNFFRHEQSIPLVSSWSM